MRTSKVVTAAAAAVLLTWLPAQSAFAFDCFIFNRSAQGAVGASHGGWFAIDIDAEAAAAVERGEVTQEQAECVTDALPSIIAIKVQGADGSGGVLALNSPNAFEIGVDGHGVEYFSAVLMSCGVAGE